MEYEVRVVAAPRGRLLVPVPFDPAKEWGAKPRHHVSGTVGGRRVRGVIEPVGEGYGFTLGAAWVRDNPIEPGTTVRVSVRPEGPQRDDLAPDVAAALAANPAAGAFFDGLAQFYRRGYLRWIDGTKGRPEVRAERIAATVEHLAASRKERPKPESDS